jgi:glycylpeptide N-tetradecanoyltransferase
MSSPTDQLARMQLDRSAPKPSYRFWETQPVAQFQQSADKEEVGPIHAPKSPADVRQEPYPLNEQFEWCLCDLADETVLTDVYDLLRLNYVEDDDEMFRFCYSKEFIRWALCPPGHNTDWYLGVRVKANQKLVRSISLTKNQQAL